MKGAKGQMAIPPEGAAKLKNWFGSASGRQFSTLDDYKWVSGTDTTSHAEALPVSAKIDLYFIVSVDVLSRRSGLCLWSRKPHSLEAGADRNVQWFPWIVIDYRVNQLFP